MAQLTESERTAGIAMSFPANDEDASCSTSTPKIPRRLRKRLLEQKTPTTAEEIDAKLKEAGIRRQQFYESLSSKARTRLKSSSQTLGQEEDPSQQLQAKLNAAEKKRLSILAKAQMRLARSAELRQAAKTGLEMRIGKERDELGLKVESRVQQAEARRMLLIRADSERRAAKKERAAKSLMKKMTQENRYKERVCAALCQKRAAAEKRRLGLLEEEKMRARARALQVQRVARAVCFQREIERTKYRDQLEDRLQRAKNYRVEYLKLRRSIHHSVCANSGSVQEQKEFLSKKLARCWRQFKSLKKTTYDLAKEYEALGINRESARSLPFEQLAARIESETAIHTAKALFDRLESRLTISQLSKHRLSGLDKIDHLLRRLASPKRGRGSGDSTKSMKPKKEVTQIPVELPRYPVRVLLCTYMVVGHPDAVLSGKAGSEIDLVDSAGNLIQELEVLIKIILNGPIQASQQSIVSGLGRNRFSSQLVGFDKAWCSYLYQFAVWKVKDAKLLEEDLIAAACQLELSMMHASRLVPGGKKGLTNEDVKAIQEQIFKEQKLLREKIQNLSGNAGVQHLELALSNIRSGTLEAKESGSPLASPAANVSTPQQPASSSAGLSSEITDMAKRSKSSSHTSDSFVKRISSANENINHFNSDVESIANHMGSDITIISENELLVNEIVHERSRGFSDIFDVGGEEQSSLKKKVKETMENAFWDSVIETMKQDKPDFSWVLRLVKEVRNELCEMSPRGWRQEIIESIDIDILSKVLSSGKLDMDFLGRILNYALVTLRKLTSPANDNSMEATHHKLLKDLEEISQSGDKSIASFASLIIKGLRFVLEQIQTLKKEISKARIRMLEPLIRGPSGLEYLKKTFTSRYGNPSDAIPSLRLTRNWLSVLVSDVRLEWEEYTESLSVVTANESCSTRIPPITLRAGGNMSKLPSPISSTAGLLCDEQPECRGERMDLFVRLGLLKQASQIVGLTQEMLPETLKLNVSRIRTIQSLFQKVIVVATSVLVLRQILIGEKLVSSPVDMENLVSSYVKQLFGLFDNVKDAGIAEIVQTISFIPEGCDHIIDQEKLQARKLVISNMLAKSLQAGYPVFERVSRTIYLATRGAVLGGTGNKGRQLAETALKRVGAAALTDKVLEVAEGLILTATVSCSVHGAWYEEILKDL